MRFTAFASSVVAVAFTAVATQAGIVPPDLNVNVQVNGNQSFNGDASGQPTGTPTTGEYVGQQDMGGWVLDWDLLGSTNPFITGTVAMTNQSAVPVTYLVDITLPIAPALAAPTLIGGSIQGGLTVDDTAGELSSAGDSIYRALIDGSEVGEPAKLFDDPTTTGLSGPFTSPTLGSESFGAPIPSAPGPAVTSSIGIRFEFTLTPGDRATFTASFVVIPTPGAAGLFAIAGLATMRRRRR
jgi:hypothetical protein